MRLQNNGDLFVNGSFFEVEQFKIHNYRQTVTSADTCRKQKAYGARLVLELESKPVRVLDFGGGKYSEAQEFLKTAGFTCEVYDPYNRSHQENVSALKQQYDVMMCNNVLNVLTDDVLDGVISDMKYICTLCGIKSVVVTVYERNKTGVGEMTGIDTYQRNQKTIDYINSLSKKFLDVTKHKKALLIKL